MKNKDILEIHDLDIEQILGLFSLAGEIEQGNYGKWLDGKIISLLFYEPSTRTFKSFESAIKRLGGDIVDFDDPAKTSVKKGENLKDTILMFSAYSDALVLRHGKDGAARAAAKYSEVPVINAGDGSHQHPTQTLLDLYTIKKEFGKIEGLDIALCGDLRYGRTVHSLLYGLGMFKANIRLCSPKNLAMPERFLSKFEKDYGKRPEQYTGLEEVISGVDVLYMTRVQKERFRDEGEYEKIKGSFILDAELMKSAKKDMIVMHPLPRVDEIADDVDDDPRARYYEQAKNGIPVRMALLSKILGV